MSWVFQSGNETSMANLPQAQQESNGPRPGSAGILAGKHESRANNAGKDAGAPRQRRSGLDFGAVPP
jgi:hypothetical protein